MRVFSSRLRSVLLIGLASVACLQAAPVLAAERYRQPPAEVTRLVDATRAPSMSISPDGHKFLLIEPHAMPGIADVSRRMLRLAGMRIDPAAASRFTTSFSKSITLRDAGGKMSTVPVAANARIGRVQWSHNSLYFAYTIITDNGTELWLADARGSAPVRLTDRLNTITTGIRFVRNGNELLCLTVPTDRGAEPAPPRAPSGPNIQETSDKTSPLRTYQDLLSNPHDEALFRYHARAQLTRFHWDGSNKPQQETLGAPAIYSQVSQSPDGSYLLLSRVQKPYSYLMTWRSFPRDVSICDRAGKLVKKFDTVPLAENIPIGGVREGRRSVGWHASLPNTLNWVEALDGGDPKAEVPHRDQWYSQAAPFINPPQKLMKVEHRARGLTYFRNPQRLLTSEYDRDRRWTRTLLHEVGSEKAPRVLEDRSVRDRYGAPGRLVSERNAWGHSVLRQDGDALYRIGRGASPRGSLPFLDRQDLNTLATERLWRCTEGSYESVSRVLFTTPEDGLLFVTRYEDPKTPPNYRLHRPAKNDHVAITNFEDPQPQLRGIHKELVTYEREDGVPLSATLYLPANYKAGTRLPLLIWAYPIEYNDKKTAGQISATPARFTQIRGASQLHLVTQGYAVMDGATIPIIGDAETMNDTFREQLVSSAEAAIDYAVSRGVADRDRVCVGGHSYGAFMTANLLAHSNLFAAGVARSGAYNRTLTPFGFQSERRTLWEAPESYFRISPFMHAQKITAPILFIHGEIDNNSGTFPVQSKRMFQAIKGHGGTARLVMLPHESHGYRARESILHTLAETIDFFDKHVKKRSPIQPASHKPR